MISKTRLHQRIKKKTNSVLAETLLLCKKNSEWIQVGKEISIPRRKRTSINLSRLNELGEEGKLVVVPGKVLSQGEVSKKLKIVALSFSEGAKEKLENANVEYSYIIEEIIKNPKPKGIQIIK